MTDSQGVYFRLEDYASLGRRLIAAAIDGVVLGLICLGAMVAILGSLGFNRATLNAAIVVLLSILFCYGVLLKRSRYRTLGYRIAGVKVVGLDGKRAACSALAMRLLFLPLGPLNWIVDLAWVSGDPHRQSLRDKLAHTYVVKVGAEPIGSGPVLFRYYDVMGYSLLLREVKVGEGKAGAVPGGTGPASEAQAGG
ncbi:MAG TPA: RDD family protein [Bryobacteraceae bacterium]|nr:RDD family protein [Bryobacteraceae bacterium]